MLNCGRLPKPARKRLTRGFGYSLTSWRSSQTVSFFPTSSYFDHQTHEQRLRDQEAAVPTRPSIDSSLRLYKDMVKPEDVCDLLWRPSFEDCLVAGLAKECPVKGDASYQVISRSSVSASKLMFANIALSWLHAFDTQVPELSDVTALEDDLTYGKSDTIPSSDIDDEIFRDAKNLHAFIDDFTRKGYSIESIAQSLIFRQSSAQQYGSILTFLSQNIHMLNPVSIKDFAGHLLNHLVNSQLSNVSEYAILLTSFISTDLMSIYPSVLAEVGPGTLDKLAMLAATSGDFSLARSAFVVLVQQKRIAPSLKTWNEFLSRYIEHAENQNLSRSQVLRDLSVIKPVLFHHELTPSVVRFLLARVTESAHDLSDLMKLVSSSSAHVLAGCGSDFMIRLQEIQTTSRQSKTVHAVQAAQLMKSLKTAGYTAN
ncbi:hypothetical protein OXX80_006841 [Metschnikowia pulcherrima]